MIRGHRQWHRRLWWILAPMVFVLFVLALVWRPQQPEESLRFGEKAAVGVEP